MQRPYGPSAVTHPQALTVKQTAFLKSKPVFKSLSIDTLLEIFKQ
ncbi:hypothetical protein [Hydrocoleum sp. CS-953]|nr:hypothetical protein [Hydrocoleum sp. CS-953]